MVPTVLKIVQIDEQELVQNTRKMLILFKA